MCFNRYDAVARLSSTVAPVLGSFVCSIWQRLSLVANSRPAVVARLSHHTSSEREYSASCAGGVTLCFAYLQSERVHCRWAMLAVAGILVQEIVRPDVFWYDAAVKVDIGGPEKILGLVGMISSLLSQLHACHATCVDSAEHLLWFAGGL